MNHQTNRILIAAIIFASASIARADLVTYDMSSTVANTLHELGTDFIIGCAILAGGVVAAVFISKRK